MIFELAYIQFSFFSIHVMVIPMIKIQFPIVVPLFTMIQSRDFQIVETRTTYQINQLHVSIRYVHRFYSSCWAARRHYHSHFCKVSCHNLIALI